MEIKEGKSEKNSLAGKFYPVRGLLASNGVYYYLLIFSSQHFGYCGRRCQNQDLRVFLGISLEVTCLLTKRQPVHRRHDLDTGANIEQENLFIDDKGKDKRLKPLG